ncbi:MAG: phenylacetate-CoA oxygenase subunit PaaC, partial [Chloroflexi bacterium]|nr:phenylacetate-CoA oxygenase subunit PaaC [Chloroflexota bacterium]
MTATPEGAAAPERRATRRLAEPDLPHFDIGDLDAPTREALSSLLLTMADDEFVLGFWDSEWTGIAPMLEEDVAFSSLAQDEIGHARLLYEMLAQLGGGKADELAFGRHADEYRHCRLLDHPRTDWAFSVVRRWLYDTADAVRLNALRRSSFVPLAQVVEKIRREESYHLMHMDVWMRRLAADGEPRERLEGALASLWPDALSMFASVPDERRLVAEGILAAPMPDLADRQYEQSLAVLANLGLKEPGPRPSAAGGRDRAHASESFRWLWGEFTMVHRLE